MATDGMVLFAVKGPGASPPTKSSSLPTERLSELLNTPVKNGSEVSVQDLRSWAGEAPTGLVVNAFIDDEFQGVLMGRVIDRRKLAYLLASVTLPTVTMWMVDDGFIAFAPTSGSWRVILASLVEPPEGHEPVFHASAVEAPIKKSAPVFDLADEVGAE